MSGLHRQMHVRTRKEHRCAYCRAVIPKGATVLCEHGVYDREPYRCYACSECEHPLYESFAYFLELGGDAE